MLSSIAIPVEHLVDAKTMQFSTKDILGGHVLSEVANLISPIFGGWDVELVKDIFWQEDADLILALLVHEGRPNMLAWHYDKQGKFSVKSAYKQRRIQEIF